MKQLIKTWETGTVDKPFYHLEFALDSESRDRRDALLKVLQSALAGGLVVLDEDDEKEEKPSALGFHVEEE
jgi:hypothetical protein